jgi:hypothetical protein
MAKPCNAVDDLARRGKRRPASLLRRRFDAEEAMRPSPVNWFGMPPACSMAPPTISA